MKAGQRCSFLLIILMAVLPVFLSVDLLAQNPIPSYNVVVESQEVFSESSGGENVTDGKRKVLITGSSSTNHTESSCSATVYVATTDQQTILGPFALTCSANLEVEIDDRQWSVLVNSDTTILVSVWIEQSDVSVILPQLFHPADKEIMPTCNPHNLFDLPFRGEQVAVLFFISSLI
ncbi:MAG TPA: hypothetical protein DCR43_00090 [Bacteroidales bacterium]|nr:MAG: hypothetical protein A2X11_04595 [Bacteroidetes bacterium GWE2_42_24]OFY27687.1 MAG: hypothetical protein A2X09_10835 [Bacteroidetes bacterium GWF2_43_11]HAQ64252.1 hypothetical protein [Bacteroidales bacterium]HBZ66537.1 hypothetical protein [Bacteroidales bacterium]